MDVEKVTHPTELLKRLSTDNIKLDINSDGGGEIELDDEQGWCFNGTDDQFLLGLVRINRSKVRKDFDKALHETEPRITKTDIKKAITYSLNQDKSDGLYAVLGDNSRYEYNGEDEIDSEIQNEAYEIEGCLKRNFLDDTVARDITDCITEKAGENLPRASEIFEKYENDLADDFYPYKHGVSWKQFIFDTMTDCDRKHNLEISPFFKHRNDAVGFVGCVLDEIEEYRDGDEGFFETMREEFSDKWKVNQKLLKEVSEERGIPFEVLEHCTHGGFETLEKFRPIPIQQQFLETFGTEIREPEEQAERIKEICKMDNENKGQYKRKEITKRKYDSERKKIHDEYIEVSGEKEFLSAYVCAND